ncbi:hypothetical protein FRC03_012273 [Tulasnella sp. 419]|nr:hypothetical protein FRC03_012273 [Tulasnella sp. 419]
MRVVDTSITVTCEFCGKKFNSPAGVTNHQNRCSFAQAASKSQDSSLGWAKHVEKRKRIIESRLTIKKPRLEIVAKHGEQAVSAMNKTLVHKGLLQGPSAQSDVPWSNDSDPPSPGSNHNTPSPPPPSPPPLHTSTLAESELLSSSLSPMPANDLGPQPTIQTSETSHRTRQRRLPKKFQDFLPTGVSRVVRQIWNQVEAANPPNRSISRETHSPASPPRILPRVRLLLPKWKTPLNQFRIYREYHTEPTHVPDQNAQLDSFRLPSSKPMVSDTQRNKSESTIEAELTEAVSPFPNLTSFWFRRHHSSSQVSKNSMDKLQQLILHRRFKPSDLSIFNRDKIDQLLSDSVQGVLSESKGWIQQNVEILVPLGKGSDEAFKTFTVEGLHYRKLYDVVKSSLEDESILRRFHFQPFKQYWQPHGSGSQIYERIYDEIYTSDAMIAEHEKLQRSDREPGCTRERVIVGMLFASDATQLATFGQAKAWPLYLFYGNHSKYERCMPTANLTEHVAFFPSLPDEIQDFILETLGKAAGKPVITHCRRELMHAIWSVILDDEFIAAWKHGIVVKCFDGIERRFYLRIFTYSADYPEKALIATIRDMGKCPCPRCLVEKPSIELLGTVVDMRYRETRARVDDESRRWRVEVARRYIYGDLRAGVTSTAVDDVLKQRSEVPTVNAFSKALAPLGFDFHKMLVNDFLHEFELGEWKALFTHLIRILYSQSNDLVHELDARFRQIDPFGRDTIRPFHHNVSEMKKIGARDFEDILQCCIPVFEDLLPTPHNQSIRRLLFATANLHALCKLRIHTETTLKDLKEAVSRYGVLIRHFKKHTCAQFVTYETPKEIQARARRLGRKDANNTKQGIVASASKPACRPQKEFNLERFKLHAMGDYPATIQLFGTTDSYSTQRSELQHTKVKGWFGRTSKTKTATKQMTCMDVIERRLRVIGRRVDQILGFEKQPQRNMLHDDHPQERYEVAKDPRSKTSIGHFLRENDGDPALKYFYSHLMEHLQSRLHGFSSGNINASGGRVIIKDNILFRHTHARFNYTTYDIRRAQDTLSMRTARRNIMVASNDPDDKHPFWYARVLGIFHTFAAYAESHSDADKGSMKRIDFLWVRWFALDHQWKGGFKPERLDRVAFIPHGPTAFGFVDPSDVVRTCHLIPAFSKGRTKDLLDTSFVRDKEGDFRFFFVNRFLDRDMHMRYRGDGIGHRDVATRLNTEYSMLSDSSDIVDLDIEDEEAHDRSELDGSRPDGSRDDDASSSESSSESDEEVDSGDSDEDGGEEDVIYDM